MGTQIRRAALLYDQSRYDLAEQELRTILTHDPDSGLAHALLALCLARREEFAEATREAQTAIGIDPSNAYFHYCLADVLQTRNRPEEAEASVRQAIELDPEDADYWAKLASIYLQKADWNGALDAAEDGLSYDAEHVACGNLRTMALTNLGRGSEATQSVDETLSRHPDNAYAHAAKGWALLQQSKPHEALEHFREALRLNPTLEYARSGMIEALKARNPVYRFMLGYFLWMARLDSRVQWGVILGAYFGQRVLSSLARKVPALAPWVFPIVMVYLGFVLLTWFSIPFFNLLLRFNRYGKHALSRDERRATDWFAGCLAGGLLSVGVYLVTGNAFWNLVAGYCVTMALPIITVFSCDEGWPRTAMSCFAVGMALLGLAVLGLLLAENVLGAVLVVPYLLLAFMGAPIIGTYLASRTVKR